MIMYRTEPHNPPKVVMVTDSKNEKLKLNAAGIPAFKSIKELSKKTITILSAKDIVEFIYHLVFLTNKVIYFF